MSNRWLTQARIRSNAYEIPTWAIANAIRRRAAKAKAVVPDDPQPPQRPDGVAVPVGLERIVFDVARP